MGGSTEQKTSSNSTTQTNPYAPAIGPINDAIGQIGSYAPSPQLTGTQQTAFNGLMSNAQAGNPYSGQIGSLATDLLNGGTDRTGTAQGAYDTYKSQMSPYATMDTNPYSNPAFSNLISTMTGDLTNSIKSQYAGAGYSPTSSGDYAQQLGRGISQGVAPTFLQAYNDLSGQKLGAINGLYGAGNSTTGLLSGLDQNALANRQAGVGASSAALQAQDSPYQRMLDIAQQQQMLPLQNIGSAESMLLPIAQLGGTSNTNGTQTSSTQVPLSQQIMGGVLGTAGILGGTGGFGPSGWLYGGTGSLFPRVA